MEKIHLKSDFAWDFLWILGKPPTSQDVGFLLMKAHLSMMDCMASDRGRMMDPSPKNEHFAKSLNGSSIHIAISSCQLQLFLVFVPQFSYLVQQLQKKKPQKAMSDVGKNGPSLISTARALITLINFTLILHSSWDSIKAPRSVGSRFMGPMASSSLLNTSEFSITISPKQKKHTNAKFFRMTQT